MLIKLWHRVDVGYPFILNDMFSYQSAIEKVYEIYHPILSGHYLDINQSSVCLRVQYIWYKGRYLILPSTTIGIPYLKSLCIPGYELKKMQMNMNFQGKTVSSTHKNSINHDNRPHEVDRCSFNINNYRGLTCDISY